MRALAESQVWDFTLRVKRGHFYHILRSRTHESNVFTPYSRCVHSSVRVGPGTVGGWFACERVMGSSGFSFFEVFSRILSLRGHVTVVGYGFWKITYKTGGKWVYNLKMKIHPNQRESSFEWGEQMGNFESWRYEVKGTVKKLIIRRLRKELLKFG